MAKHGEKLKGDAMKQGANSLTPKQHSFVMEFMLDRNGTQAAIRAGYSERTANEQACGLLAKPSIRAAIDELTQARAEKVQITAENVLSSILRIRDKAEADEKNGDALKANELLGKHLKLFTDKVELTGKDGGAIEYTNTERAARLAALLDRAGKERARQSTKG